MTQQYLLQHKDRPDILNYFNRLMINPTMITEGLSVCNYVSFLFDYCALSFAVKQKQ